MKLISLFNFRMKDLYTSVPMASKVDFLKHLFISLNRSYKNFLIIIMHTPQEMLWTIKS